MDAMVRRRAPRWRDRRPLPRLALELTGIVVIKLAVLMLIWYVAIRPLPRADTSPDAVGKLLGPASSATVTPAREHQP
ncbi:hypothetical protein FHW69_002449 [Luteibacter sp. Sphag1AF]|uniref:cytochrome oxidase putative small subunit CydP n=1 Tax=Luteibacter sp. Sphag1AF TaxID=2587031 RepID=UPI00161D0F84|nr:cytochrome oxidase putative small subunit CydP [Luteibacter sp. Sphag1AF]MBB3227817.1 hypothetical protein [Luteibacter sp. Sphag1AF]